MKITKTMQKVAADILTELTFARDMDEVWKVYDRVFEQYGLHNDPFTHLPCTSDEWYENKLEYDRQTMIERYGHCDGLD